MPQEIIISKKYANAFLNQYINELSDKLMKQFVDLEFFLKKNELFYIYLRIPRISYLVKQKALNRVAQAFELCKPLRKLMFVVLEHDRIEILDSILNQIIACYRERKNIQLFKIISSHTLSTNEKEKIINFVKHVARGDVITDFIVDEELIFGCRIQSKTFLWERSVPKQLRDVRRSIFKQVGLW